MDGKKPTQQDETDFAFRLMEEAAAFKYGTEEAVFAEKCPRCGKQVRYKSYGSIWEYCCDTPECFHVKFYGI